MLLCTPVLQTAPHLNSKRYEMVIDKCKARANWIKQIGTRGCTLMGVLLVTLKGKGRTVMCVSALGSW